MASSAITMSITAMDVIFPVFMCVTILMSLRAVVVHLHRTTTHTFALDNNAVDLDLVSNTEEKQSEFKTKRNYSQETVSMSDPEVIEQVLVKKSFLFPIACETPASAREEKNSKILKRIALKALSGQRFKKFTSVIHRKCAAWADNLLKLKLNGKIIISEVSLLNIGILVPSSHVRGPL